MTDPPSPHRDELRKLAEEQAALRRVATLVARESSPEQVFTAVAEEVVRLLGVENTMVYRYETGTAVNVAVAGAADLIPVGTRVPLDGDSVALRVRETARPARIDGYEGVASSPGALARRFGIRSAVATPIVVEGMVWGAMFALSRRVEPLPAETESRIDQFTQLVGTAIANAAARAEVARLADEQAALRRVAGLVAHGDPPTAVFEAVACEAARVLDAERVWLLRYEQDATATVMMTRGLPEPRIPVGMRLPIEGEGVFDAIWRTGRLTRIDDWEDASGLFAEIARSAGVRSAVGVPIVVEGRVWGAMSASWIKRGPAPGEIEERMGQFAELAGTAIANADSRAQLTASRARVIAAADAARRRVVRDLHDGAQQRLVHTIVTLKLAQRALREGTEEAEPLVAEGLEQAQRAIDELRELAHGILPSVLTRGGLQAGVAALLSRASLPVTADVPSERFPPGIEASAYFVVAEALTNVAKHARATRAEVRAFVADAELRVEVRDDGVGGADVEGSGLVGLDDRVAAMGGRLWVESPPEGGTVVAAALPLAPLAPLPPPD